MDPGVFPLWWWSFVQVKNPAIAPHCGPNHSATVWMTWCQSSPEGTLEWFDCSEKKWFESDSTYRRLKQTWCVVFFCQCELLNEPPVWNDVQFGTKPNQIYQTKQKIQFCPDLDLASRLKGMKAPLVRWHFPKVAFICQIISKKPWVTALHIMEEHVLISPSHLHFEGSRRVTSATLNKKSASDDWFWSDIRYETLGAFLLYEYHYHFRPQIRLRFEF